MALKSKITEEMIENIEVYAEDQYSLDDMFDELNISKKLMQDEQILNAYERGLTKYYISMKTSGLNDEEIAQNNEITTEQCILWCAKYSDTIAKQIKQKDEQVKTNTRRFSDPLSSGIICILTQNGNMKDSERDKVSSQQVADDIRDMVKKMQNGDTTEMLITLVSNNLQLQSFNQHVTHNLMGKVGERLDNFELLSKMQLRVMNEVRKNTMVINEIVNPKRTTFIKEANQHNHLHQENSEKKLKNQNELQKTEQLPATEHIEDIEIIPLKEIVHEDK